MMLKKLSFVMASFLFIVLQCNAVFGAGSGGYRNEVVDAEASGKGYSFVAQADAPSAIYYNPAGLTQLEGDHITVGYTMEMPRFENDSDVAGNTIKMEKQTIWIPHLYYVTDLGRDGGNIRIGFGATAPYGLSTDWPEDSFSANYATESDLEVLNFNPTVAYKINDKISIGAGLDYTVAHLSKYKKLTLTAIGGISDSGGEFHLKGSDKAYGYNLGLLLSSSDKQHRIGLSYRSEINLTYEGTVTLADLNAATAVAFGGATTYTTDMRFKATIPRSIAVGYAYKPSEKWTIEADVEWTDWACVEDEFVEYPNEGGAPAARLAVLNSGNPVSRDWNDVFAYGIGAEYNATDRVDLRFGLLYHESPIPSVTLGSALPDSNKIGGTIGLGYENKSVRMDLSYAHFRYSSRNVTNDVGAVTGTNIDGTYRAYVNILAVGFTHKF